jgi:sugar phosphate isomerase/epimerase
MTLFPSACVWAENSPIDWTLTRVKQTAFHYIDVEPTTLDAPGALQKQKELGLNVSCVALDHNLPAGCSWDARGDGALRKTVDHLKATLAKSQALGAKIGYVGPCKDRKQLKAFREAVSELAAAAAEREIKLCLEHMPDRALASGKETLAFVEEAGHPNLYLLLDTGHCLISKERPWELAEAAGKRLGYVQMNDNDGKKDRHWALLDGRLTADDLTRTLAALHKIGYGSTLGLEFKPKPRTTLISDFSRNHNLLLRLQQGIERQAK